MSADWEVTLPLDVSDAFQQVLDRVSRRADVISRDFEQHVLEAKSLKTGDFAVRVDFRVSVASLGSSRSSVTFTPVNNILSSGELWVLETLFTMLSREVTGPIDPQTASNVPMVRRQARTSSTTMSVWIAMAVVGVLVIIIGSALKDHFAFDAAVCDLPLYGSGSGGAVDCAGAQGAYLVGELGWWIGLVLLGTGVVLSVREGLGLASASTRRMSNPGSVKATTSMGVSTTNGSVQATLTGPTSVKTEVDTSSDVTHNPDTQEIDEVRRNGETMTQSVPEVVSGVPTEPPVSATLQVGDDGFVASCAGCGSGVADGDLFCNSCGERLYFDNSTLPEGSNMLAASEVRAPVAEDEGLTHRRTRDS